MVDRRETNPFPSVSPLLSFFGLVIEYDGSYGPTTSFGPFNYAIFGNTSMTSDGNLLTMTTFFPGEGVWFGRWGDLGPSNPGHVSRRALPPD